MTDTSNTVPQNDTTHDLLRAHRDELIANWFGPRQVLDQLVEYAQEQGIDVGPKELSQLARSGNYKTQLVPTERTREYLSNRARIAFDRGDDRAEALRLVRGCHEMHCEEVLPDWELLAIVDQVEQGETSEPDQVGVIMSDVQAESVEWLWPGRIPLSKLTVLDGDPGLGKSVITMDLAARVTTGRTFPDGALDGLGGVGGLGGVVMLSAEDGLADTIRPRLDAAGADTSRIVAISTVPDSNGNERTMSIPGDIRTIERAIRRVDAKLVIIDPLMAFLSGKANYDQDVRKALTPLARMAECTGVAVLVVRHLNKNAGGKAIYRGGSSIGIIGAARSGLVVETHPDDRDLRVLATSKSNLAMKADSLTYTIVTADNDTAKVSWGTTINLDADDLLNPDVMGEEEKAVVWLEDTLRDGPMLQEHVKTSSEAAGIAWRTLERAKSTLGVKSKRVGKQWSWELPDEGRQDRHVRQDRQGCQEEFVRAAYGEMDDDVPFN